MLCSVLSRSEPAAATLCARPHLRDAECEGNSSGLEAPASNRFRAFSLRRNPTMTLDTVTLSRLQFAFTIAYHIMWPAYSIGIARFIVLLNALWLPTGKTVY